MGEVDIRCRSCHNRFKSPPFQELVECPTCLTGLASLLRCPVEERAHDKDSERVALQLCVNALQPRM